MWDKCGLNWWDIWKGTEWTLWTRTLLTTMQPASGKILHTRFFDHLLRPNHCSCFLQQGTSNRESQRHHCCLGGNVSFAQCGRDGQESQVCWSINNFNQNKQTQKLYILGPARVRTRWEAVCQEGWAEAGEDQCKRETKQSSPMLTPLSSLLVWSFNTLMLLQ